MVYINYLGGPGQNFTELTKRLWLLIQDLGITLTACYLSGSLNCRADTLSCLSPLYKDWALHNSYVNLPFRFIPQVLQIASEQKAEATVMVPYWPAQYWITMLLSMLVDNSIKLPNSPHLLVTSANCPEPLRNRGWSINA